MKPLCRHFASELCPRLLSLIVALIPPATSTAQTNPNPVELLARYFRAETEKLADRCLADIQTIEDWQRARETYRQQLLEMLGLAPRPARTDLMAATTGKLEHDEFTVEKVHFQSLPGLYVTANFYLPKHRAKPVPAILYLCGHALVATNGISYGNKTAYQHHGIWFARNGYACLLIDTIQLGEIQGIHHGTYRENMWWWNARGYTPAGVETWNATRALDYLQTRPEVDSSRIGVTGRSGGGAYSWTAAALDDRIKVAAPVAGITDLQNHVMDGTVEGHCDCMFFVNTYGWDYPLLAALTAPRPLLICNSDKDSIFPLDGVFRVHSKVKRVYDLYGSGDKLGLLITEGPHKDTQDLQVPVFRWFNRHLKGEDPVIEIAARKLFTPSQLRVFDQLPTDERTTRIHESFVTPAPQEMPPKTTEEWAQRRDTWKRDLMQKVFGGWPRPSGAPFHLKSHEPVERDELVLQIADLETQPNVPLRIYLLRSAHVEKPERLVLIVLGAEDWTNWIGLIGETFGNELVEESQGKSEMRNAPEQLLKLKHLLKSNRTLMAYIVPRGIGRTAWRVSERDQVQIRRRFMLLGQTLEGMRVYDILSVLNAILDFPNTRGLPVTLQAQGTMAVNALYASLFATSNHDLQLTDLPSSHRTGPDYLNVLRVLDIPQTLAMAAEKNPVKLHTQNLADWDYPRSVQKQLGWPNDRLQISRGE